MSEKEIIIYVLLCISNGGLPAKVKHTGIC